MKLNLSELNTRYIGAILSFDAEICGALRADVCIDRRHEEVIHGYKTSPKYLPYNIIMGTTKSTLRSIIFQKEDTESILKKSLLQGAREGFRSRH